eukprot:s66_g12.t1
MAQIRDSRNSTGEEWYRVAPQSRNLRPADSPIACFPGPLAPASRAPVPKDMLRPRQQEVVVVGGGSSPDLHGASIWLPRLGLHAYDKVVYFEVVVTPKNGAPWQVLRRYNHFRALVKDPAISAVFAGATRSFPAKIWHTPRREELQERRSRLEEWLKAALIQASSYGELPEALRKFLLLGRTPKLQAQMQPATARGKLQDCTLSFAAEAFDKTTASAPLAEGGDDGLELLHVPIPASLGPEDLLRVKTPDEKIIVISVPWGLAPGATLQLWWDQAAGMLGVHHRQDWQALRVQKSFQTRTQSSSGDEDDVGRVRESFSHIQENSHIVGGGINFEQIPGFEQCRLRVHCSGGKPAPLLKSFQAPCSMLAAYSSRLAR